MKKALIVLFVFSLTHVLNAQVDPVNALFEKYAGAEGFTTVNITGDLLKLAAQCDPEDDDLKKVSKLNHIRVLVQEEAIEGLEELNFYDEVCTKLDNSLYKELIVVIEKDEQVKMMVREEDDVIKEFLIVVGSEDENVLVSIRGDINLDDLEELSESIDFKCSDKMKLAKEHNH